MARPILAAMAEQQQVLEQQRESLRHYATVTHQQAEQIHVLTRRTAQYEAAFRAHREQLTALGRGLKVLAEAAGVEPMVRTAMLHKRADEQNPAQPVPEPPAEPPVQTTQEAEMPEAMADVMSPGLVPGSTNDVAADMTSTVYTPGDDIPGPPLKNLVDVTAPVDGTQGPRPLDEVRTLTDIRVGDPMNPAAAFPLRGGFATVPRMGAKEAASNRTMAAIRLARLRLSAGLAEGGSDFEVATVIEKDAAMTNERIEAEIQTLEGVAKVASKAGARPAGLVPRAASATRSVPSMQAVAGSAGAPAQDEDVADADLFLD